MEKEINYYKLELHHPFIIKIYGSEYKDKNFVI